MTRTPKLLALDDDRSWLSQIPLILEDQNIDVQCYSSINSALQAMETQFFDFQLPTSLTIRFK